MGKGRLTTRKLDGLVVYKGESETYISNMNYGEVRMCMDRLATLEDLIEERVLVETHSCRDCRFQECLKHNYPCSHCTHNYNDLFESKKK